MLQLEIKLHKEFKNTRLYLVTYYVGDDVVIRELDQNGVVQNSYKDGQMPQCILDVARHYIADDIEIY